MLYNSIDLDKALEQLGGSDKLYKTVVSGFYDKYRHVDDTIFELFEADEFEEARRLAHSIKGLSGNLGAKELRLKALDLEMAIKNKQPTIDLEMLEFSKELEAVIKEVKMILVNKYDALAEQSPTVIHGESQFIEAANVLLNALSTYRFSDVKTSLNELQATKVPEKYSSDVHKVIALINEYEYDLAGAILRKMTNK